MKKYLLVASLFSALSLSSLHAIPLVTFMRLTRPNSPTRLKKNLLIPIAVGTFLLSKNKETKENRSKK